MNKYKAGDFESVLNALPAVVVFIILYLVRGNPFEDDSYIFYRYAENWASGLGPVFNAGEYVEGYSSLLWTFLLAIGSYLSFDLVLFAPLLNLFIGAACLFYVSFICGFIEFSKPRITAVGLSLTCSLSYGFYYYGAIGMDTLIASLVVLFSVTAIYKALETGRYVYALLPLFLLNIVRAEGFLYSTVFISVMAYYVFSDKDISSRKEFIVTALIFVIMTAVLFGIRYSLYHEWMPATMIAKGFGTYSLKTAVLKGDLRACKDFIKVILSGITYESFLFFTGAWIPFIILFRKGLKNNTFLWLMASAIGVNIFVSVWAGGDYFPYQRHFITVLPVSIVFVAWSFDIIYKQYLNGSMVRKALLLFISTLVIVSWLYVFIAPQKSVTSYPAEGDVSLVKLGKVLRQIPGSTTLLTNMVGKLPYYAGQRVYARDILGLTDIHNAKYGDTWGIGEWGKGVCGRTDFNYSFASPFDIFFYNSKNIHNRFISFCAENPSECENYIYLISNQWPDFNFYIIVNNNHPITNVLIREFNAFKIPVSEAMWMSTENLSDIPILKGYRNTL